MSKQEIEVKINSTFVIINKWTPHPSCQQLLYCLKKLKVFIYLMKLFIHTSSKPFLETIKSSKKKLLIKYIKIYE